MAKPMYLHLHFDEKDSKSKRTLQLMVNGSTSWNDITKQFKEKLSITSKEPWAFEYFDDEGDCVMGKSESEWKAAVQTASVDCHNSLVFHVEVTPLAHCKWNELEVIPDVSIHCYKELLSFICTDEFKNEYGEVYIIPKRLNQDIVESFFSVQRQLCRGNRNMTAYTYGYNLNGIMSLKSSNLVSRSQTNVNSITDVAGDLDALAAYSLPKQSDNSSIYKLVPCVANLPQL